MKIELEKTQKITNWIASKLYYHHNKTGQRNWKLKRGEVYYVNLGENIGSEENKCRPCLVIQADSYNFNSPVFLGAIISNSHLTIADIQIPIKSDTYLYSEKGINKYLSGTIDLGQIKTIAKERIIFKMAILGDEMEEVNFKLFNILGLTKILRSKENTIKSLVLHPTNNQSIVGYRRFSLILASLVVNCPMLSS